MWLFDKTILSTLGVKNHLLATSPNRIDYLGKRAVLLSQLAIAVWPDDYIIFQSLALYIIENLPSRLKIAKVGTKFTKYQINSVPKNSQGLLKCCKSGEISPNLVTLQWQMSPLSESTYNR